jgi:hypothetical protein
MTGQEVRPTSTAGLLLPAAGVRRTRGALRAGVSLGRGSWTRLLAVGKHPSVRAKSRTGGPVQGALWATGPSGPAARAVVVEWTFGPQAEPPRPASGAFKEADAVVPAAGPKVRSTDTERRRAAGPGRPPSIRGEA